MTTPIFSIYITRASKILHKNDSNNTLHSVENGYSSDAWNTLKTLQNGLFDNPPYFHADYTIHYIKISALFNAHNIKFQIIEFIAGCAQFDLSLESRIQFFWRTSCKSKVHYHLVSKIA